MGVVKGAIGITDNVTAVLRSIKKEQASFRQDVEKTKTSLKQTWDKKYNARIEASAASKTLDTLKKKMEPLRKKIVTAVAVKDMAMSKVKEIGNKVKSIGKMVAKPVVTVAVKGAEALSSLGKGIAKIGAIAAAGYSAVSAVVGVGLKKLFSSSLEIATSAIEAETQLAQVMKNTTGATQKDIQSVIGLAQAQEKIGVVSAGISISGMQELGTYITETNSLKSLMPVMNDMLAQQYGLNATQEQAVNIATMMGKVLNGQVGGLSRLGYSFDEAQERTLKYGTEAERVSTLIDVITESVGGMNEALANTDTGKIRQMENSFESVKEEVGRVGITLKAKFADVIMENLPVLQNLGSTTMSVLSRITDVAIPFLGKAIKKVVPVIEKGLNNFSSTAEKLIPVMSGIFDGFSASANIVKPILDNIAAGFVTVLPQVMQFGGTVMSTVSQLSASVMPVIDTIINTVIGLIPTILPVMETVISAITSVVSTAAPIVSGMVEGISAVVTTLAPVFQTIFSQISEKVGSVISFVSERMGFVQEVIGTVAPLISDILTTAWGVIGPIMDLVISVFELLWSVAEAVFPAVQGIIEGFWNAIKGVIEAIGGAISTVAGAIKSLSSSVGSFFGGKGAKVGANAEGTNNWRGGPTWVGEKGPELIDLPKGTRVLPNKESVSLMNSQQGNDSIVVPKVVQAPSSSGVVEKVKSAVSVTIAKLADQIIIREDADIDRLADMVGNVVAKKVMEVAVNMG